MGILFSHASKHIETDIAAAADPVKVSSLGTLGKIFLLGVTVDVALFFPGRQFLRT